MADRVIRAVITGDTAGLSKALSEAGVKVELAGKNIEKSAKASSASMSESLAGVIPGGSKVTDMLEKLKNPYVAVATVAVAAAVTIGAASIDMANKYDDATTHMAATAGISIEAANKVGDAFLTTAGTTTFSAQAMMEAYGPVSAQLGTVNGKALTASQALNVMTASTTLAEASGQDLNTTTKNLASVMQAFHQPMSDAAADTDVLFNASRATGVSIDTLTTQIDKSRSKLGALGGSLSQQTTLLTDFAMHGLTGKTALTAMDSATNALLATDDKSMASYQKQQAVVTKAQDALDKLRASHKATAAQIQAAQATLDTANKKLDDLGQGAAGLGLNIYNAQGQFVGMQSIIEQLGPKLKGMSDAQRRTAEDALFGAGSFDKLDATIMAGKGGWDAASAAVNKHGAAEDAASKNTSTLSASFDKMKAAAVDIGIQIGQKLMPVLEKVMQWVSQGVVWFAQHLPQALNIAGKVFQVVFAAIGILIQAWVKSIQVAIAIITPVIQTIATVFSVVFNVVSTIIGAIINVIKTIEPPIQAVVSVIVDVFSVAFKVISTVVGTEIGIVTNIIKGIVGVVQAIAGPIGAVFTGISTVVGGIFNGISTLIGKAISTVVNIVKGIVDVPINVVNKVIDIIDGVKFTVPSWVPGIGGDGWQGLGIPHIPTLDTPGGSLVTAPTLAALSQNSVPEVVIPLPDYMRRGAGSGVVINQTITITSNDTKLKADVQNMIQANNKELAELVTQKAA